MTTGIDNCLEKLQSLVKASQRELAEAKTHGDDAYQQKVDYWVDALIDFANGARPASEIEESAIARIQAQASKVARRIRWDAITDSVEEIERLSEELKGFNAVVRDEALSNHEDAKRLRLIPVKNIIDSLTGAIGHIKGLKDNLDLSEMDEQQIATEIDALIEKYQTVKKAIDAL